MQAMVCERCGSNEFIEDSSSYICVYCKTRFNKEKKSVNNTIIDVNSDVERLLEKCRREPKKAARYASLVLDIDPTNLEALRYL